ncbi:transposase family protein [Streptomyces sp. NPDC093594]|uniref:transposase family protein n=1 Tax=Streptomyces sp. NPDC093594 TaxID=3155305 RepID=UPI00344D4BFE
MIDGTEIRVRRQAAWRKDRGRFIPGENKQNAVKSMMVTDGEARVLWCSPARPASCADITPARQLGLVKLLADGPAVEILADAGYQGLGAQTGGTACDAAPPEVQEERLRLVRGDVQATAQSTLPATYPCRARHHTSEELAGPGPTPRSPRTHERHRPGHRQPAVSPAGPGPALDTADVNRFTTPKFATSHRLPCTSSLVTVAGPPGRAADRR